MVHMYAPDDAYRCVCFAPGDVKVRLFYPRGYILQMCNFFAAGDVEIGLMERNGGLEVEVVQARGLSMKPGSKGPPGIIN